MKPRVRISACRAGTIAWNFDMGECDAHPSAAGSLIADFHRLLHGTRRFVVPE